MAALMITSIATMAQEEEMEEIAEAAVSHDQVQQHDINEMHGAGFTNKYNINSIT